MKKILCELLIIFSAAQLHALPSSYYAPTRMGPAPCQLTESALLEELSNMNTGQKSVQDHIKTAQIYKSLSVRGCHGNRDAYKMYSLSSLESARALNNINNQWQPYDKIMGNQMIHKTAQNHF